MAATVKNLREILFNVEPPKLLMDRKTEEPLFAEGIFEKMKKSKSQEERRALFDEVALKMVRHDMHK